MKKTSLIAFVALIGAASAAQAAQVTYNYQLTGLSGDLAAYGLSSTDTIDVQVTFDDTSSGVNYYNNSHSYYVSDDLSVYDYYSGATLTTTVNIGSQTFVSTDYSSSYYNRLYVRDGISDGTYDINDYFYHYSENYNSTSTTYDYMYVYGYTYNNDESTWSGLNPIGTFENGVNGNTTYGYFYHYDNSNYNSINASTIILGGGGVSEVPLPASAPLLLAGLGGVWAMKRRKKAA